MGIFLLTDFHGFAKSFFTLITKGSPPTLSISAWDNATYGHRTMQFCILTRQGGVNACALARWTHSVFRAYGVSYTSFLLSAAGCLIEYVHVYTLHKLPGVQPMVTVQCSFAFWPDRVV